MVWLLGEKDSKEKDLKGICTRKMESRHQDQQVLKEKTIPQSYKQGGSWDQGVYRDINYQASAGAHQLTGWSSASFQLFRIVSWSSEFVCSMAWCTHFLWQEHTKTVLSFGEPVKACVQETWKSKYLIFSPWCFLL